jgi:hypothetical protein
MTDSSVISVKYAGEFVPSRCSDPAVADCGEKFDNDRGNLLRANLNGGCWDDTEVGNGQSGLRRIDVVFRMKSHG